MVNGDEPETRDDGSGSMPCIEMGEFASLLLNNALVDRINSVLGTMKLNLTNDEYNPFSTMTTEFSADILGMDASVPKSATTEILQKI
eukprot:6586876-Ditylum_brightwellii.AAC.1